MDHIPIQDLLRLRAQKQGDDGVGDVMVVGGGISGIQAALDMGNAGFKVYLVEKSPTIGGKMAQLDKTYPTIDCSMCIESPKFIECARHPNIELMSYTEVDAVEGAPGDFTVTLLRKPRYVTADACTGCGVCTEYCPVKIPDPFNQDLSLNKAVHIHFAQAVPLVPYIGEQCLFLKDKSCTICESVCEKRAIDFSQKPEKVRVRVGAVVLSPGYEILDPGVRGDYGYGSFENVVTSLDFERLLCSTGPHEGHILRPSDKKHPHKVAWIQCVGSRQVVPDRVVTAAAATYDLVVGADGVFSTVRAKHEAHFNPRIDLRTNRFIWLGTKKKLDTAFTFSFKETEWGWFNLHAYRFNDEMSTFIVETPEPTWYRAGLDKKEPQEAIAFCENLFADLLDGNKLISNARHLRGSAVWLKFNRVLCERWYKDNIVLIGDAAHTAHFAIGSGTKLAMEDAISLVKVLNSSDGTVPQRLARYQAEREIEALRLQSAARNRMSWFEDIDRYVHMEPEQLAFSLLTASQRVGHANQQLRDAKYVEGFDRWFQQQAGLPDDPAKPPVPPMFTPFKLRGMTLSNRVVVSPMCTYSATDGMPNDFHFQHYAARGLGGAALVITEMTCTAPDARITPGCAGIWNDAQQNAWQRIVDFVHANSDAKMALQIGHAGRKGSTRLSWDGIDQPLNSGNWALVAPSPLPLMPGVSQTPREMNRADMDKIKADFVAATQRANAAGFDMVEFHAAHGYLMSSFISPLTNQRGDEYGGSLENRCRYPLEVFQAMRAVWPADKPMSVRISAHDWVPGGTTPADAAEVARLFKAAGADIIHVSSGQVSKDEQPVYGRMFQAPFSDRIRNEVRVPTIAVGNIYEADHVNTIIAAGRADLCALARPHLADPAWTLHSAAEQKYAGIRWPRQYAGGKLQLERNLERAAQLALNA